MTRAKVLLLAFVLATTTLSLAGFLADAGTASAHAVPHRASARPADHWGAYFGDRRSADRDRTLRPKPMRFPDRSRIRQVGSSNSSQYALLADGTVWAWGQGTNGQLGNGKRRNSFDRPVRVRFPARVKIAFLATDAMPYDGALAVDRAGHAWAWGDNKGGEDCLGTTGESDLPVKITALRAPVTALAGADQHATYDAAGTVYACGQDNQGVLGDGRKGVNSRRPVRVQRINGAKVIALTQSQDDAGALLADGTYYDWGGNKLGQLGDGRLRSSDVPVPVRLPAPVTDVAQGGSAPGNGQVLVKLSTGALYGWGSDAEYQLGTGTKAAVVPFPVRFFAPARVRYAALASGGATSYAIDTSGRVWAWGDGHSGQIGDRRTTTAKVPVRVHTGARVISSTANDVVVAG